MKNELKRNHQAIAAQFRKAGVHADQNKKTDKKQVRRQARTQEKESLVSFFK